LVEVGVDDADGVLGSLIRKKVFQFIEGALIEGDKLHEQKLAQEAARQVSGETREEENHRLYREDIANINKRCGEELAAIGMFSVDWAQRRSDIRKRAAQERELRRTRWREEMDRLLQEELAEIDGDSHNEEVVRSSKRWRVHDASENIANSADFTKTNNGATVGMPDTGLTTSGFWQQVISEHFDGSFSWLNPTERSRS